MWKWIVGGVGVGLLAGALWTRRVRGAQREPGTTPGLGRLSEELAQADPRRGAARDRSGASPYGVKLAPPTASLAIEPGQWSASLSLLRGDF